MKKTIEYHITLSGLLKTSSYAEVARLLSLTKDGVRQMILRDREIYIRFISKDKAEYCEFKSWVDGTRINAGPSEEWKRASKSERIAMKKARGKKKIAAKKRAVA